LDRKEFDRKVMIVDDEDFFLEPMVDLLQGIGYQASAASDGSEAIMKYTEFQPDVVLLDRNLPDMDGNDCAEKIKALDPSACIVFMSGYDEEGPNGIDPETLDRICGYLTKPIDIHQLTDLLKKVFKSR
jgi:CheY-like chemotaxis protein